MGMLLTNHQSNLGSIYNRILENEEKKLIYSSLCLSINMTCQVLISISSVSVSPLSSSYILMSTQCLKLMKIQTINNKIIP